MSTDAPAITGRVMLVAAPWPLFNRPSLPLGALKAYLKRDLPTLRVSVSHFYLTLAQNLGYDRYHHISQRVWRAEAIFSALLYPDQAHRAQSLYDRPRRRKEAVAGDFRQLCDRVRTVTEHWLSRIDWSALDLVGFSISFCQVTASLYLISAIKAAHPDLPIVVGGSSFSAPQAHHALAAFPQIDYLVMGEGERPLTDLLHDLLADVPHENRPSLPDGVRSFRAGDNSACGFSQLARLDELPVPDYDDYFKLLHGFAPADRFFPTLPVEASRGCWWHRQDRLGQYRGCAFCNLNLQWMGYRTKPAHRVVHEVDHLADRHQSLAFAFSDNAISAGHATEVFEGIRKSGRDLSLFVEMRADSPTALIRTMRQAGVDTVQVGIEALSSRLLEKMNKGVRAIDNLCTMKLCEAAGIVNASNLMLHFPSSDADDIAETLHSLAYARWYRPLKTVAFWLGLDSPVHRNPDRFNIRAVFNHPNLKKLFPDQVASAFGFMIQGYRGDRQHQLRLWRPVEKAVRRWQTDYDRMMRQTGGRPALAYREGGRFLIIEQHMPGQATIRHRLTGVSAGIYRACATPVTLEALTEQFTSHSRSQIRRFCRSMVDKHLMYTEVESYLSLAAPPVWREQ